MNSPTRRVAEAEAEASKSAEGATAPLWTLIYFLVGWVFLSAVVTIWLKD